MSKHKLYYRTKYHKQLNLSKSNIKLYNQIIDLDIQTIFEFGCNIGRHLSILKNFGYSVKGMDINSTFIQQAVNDYGLDAITGDETKLKNIYSGSFDLCFTNSVICHMPKDEAEVAIKELKRISKRYIILFECISKTNDLWWIHNYESYGFKEILKSDSHLYWKNEAEYKLFICEL